MSIVLKRIYMENFKLFEKRTIEFEGSLTVFDGPNGYGKTSTFEAIELLITGDISRVLKNEAISAKLSYAENFLAKDQNKDVVIKGEFIDSISGETLVIVRRIQPLTKKRETKKKHLNPRALHGMLNTYFPTSFDLPEEKWILVSDDEAKVKCDGFFGAQNVSLYTLLHYVRQEDRLSFFKQSEEERTKTIEGLFGLMEYRERLDKAQTIGRKLVLEYNELDRRIQEDRAEIERRPKDVEVVKYEPIAKGKPAWDKEYPDFRGAKTDNLLKALLMQLDGVEMLRKHRREFVIDEATKAFRLIPEEMRAFALLAWKLCQEQANVATELEKRKELQRFCKIQNSYLQTGQYTSVKWKQFCEVMGISELATEFTSLIERISKSRKNQNDLKKSLMDLDNARNVLQQQAQKAQMLEEGTCPYCGHIWGDMDILDKQFQKTRESLQIVLGREAVDCVLWTEQIKILFQQYSDKWEKLLHELEQDVALQVFCRYANWQDFQNAAECCVPVMKRLQISPLQINLQTNLADTIDGVGELLKHAQVLWSSLSAEYMAQNQQYDFSNLFRSSFNSIEVLAQITPEVLEKKRRYLTYQYSRSFDESLEKLSRMEEKLGSLGELREQLDMYIESLNNAINAYRKQLIDHIEIPFFLYSSRLLQSYHGGQGVLITSEDGDKIRFTAPGREHDVLYTMSSGQLSAVLLAFTFSLNRIHVGPGFRTMLIDDPIQCMDDINMVSFVELLGREFGDSQVILSTHEDSFSKYIQHKYKRYGLSHNAVNLKTS